MSSHEHHEPANGSEKFAPLTDNNNNISFGKYLPMILSLAVLISLLVVGIQYAGGYLQNEQQMEWKKEHGRMIKDSDENWHEIESTSDNHHEDVKGAEDHNSGESKHEDGNVNEEHKSDDKKMEEGKMDDKKEEKKHDHDHDH